MANEVAYGGVTGQTLTFGVYTSAGVEREVGTGMTETPAASGLYLGSPTTIAAGDHIVISDAGGVIHWHEYRPEVTATDIATDLSAMDDKLDIIIESKQSVMEFVQG